MVIKMMDPNTMSLDHKRTFNHTETSRMHMLRGKTCEDSVRGWQSVCKPSREASGESKPANILTVDFQPLDSGEVNVYCLSHKGCGIRYVCRQ